MDKKLVEIIQKVFIKMYNDKLIYKGEKSINWDPKLQTVLSNIEVINKDTIQKMYYVKYDLKNGGYIEVATVRIETLYSDVAIAINSKDFSKKNLIGQIAIHPLNKKEIPIISDDKIDISKETGIMKVSAHSHLDFDIIKKNNLKIIETITKKGYLNKNCQEFNGIERFEARKLIVEKLKKMNKITKIKKIISPVGYSERTGEAIEILVQPQ
jgi:valyl-tRNA synthetase